MPRKTLALISGLVLVTIILFVIALNNSRNAPSTPPVVMPEMSQAPSMAPTSPAHSVLTLSPNPIDVLPGVKGTVNVNLDTSDNEVTAVQLEIAYDPNFISNVKVTPTDLFTSPVVFINNNNAKTGRYTYAFGIMPNHNAVKGIGSAATITFTALNKPGETSQLSLLPTTLVTARGVTSSVLKSATGTLVEITQP